MDGHASTPTEAVTPVVARQPIFDRARRVIAFELLYRGPADADGAAATARVMIDTLSNFDFGVLAPGARVFVNMPRAALDWSLDQMLPAERLVLEVLEDVTPDAGLLAALDRQRAAGFRIALDDFEWSPAHAPLVAVADYVKLDVLAQGERLADSVARCRRPGLALIAEKVETAAQLEACAALGFDAFQGFVFCQPEPGAHGPLPAPSLVLVELVAALRNPEVGNLDLASLLKRDATLAYQILRLANSPLNGVRRRIRSLEDALVVLGADAIRNWASILLLARLPTSKPRELLELAVARGAMCVRAGELLGIHASDVLYTIGLFSVLDALLDRQMRDVLAGLALADPVRGALLGEGGVLGGILRLVVDFEQGRWHSLRVDVADSTLAALGDTQAAAFAESRAALRATE